MEFQEGELSVLEHYDYRKGYVRGVELPRPQFEDLHRELARLAGVAEKNHQCFLFYWRNIEWDDSCTVAVMFTDTVVVFGNRVLPQTTP